MKKKISIGCMLLAIGIITVSASRFIQYDKNSTKDNLANHYNKELLREDSSTPDKDRSQSKLDNETLEGGRQIVENIEKGKQIEGNFEEGKQLEESLSEENPKDVLDASISSYYMAPNIIVHDSDYESLVWDAKGSNSGTENNQGEDSKSSKFEAAEASLNISNPSIQVDASSALLMDYNSGKILYHKNALSRIYPASTTKLMTAIVALDLCEPEEEVTVGEEITRMAIDSSRAYLKVGERLTLQMLLEGLLLPSGNDAAYTIAAYVGRISKDNMGLSIDEGITEFIRLMNEKVKELDLVDTHFKNPDGYDEEGQYTTAYDMALIAKKALEHQLIRTISQKRQARNVFLSGEDVTWHSANKLIQSNSGVYYKYAIGLKTGTSSLAGRCLVSAAANDNKTIISVVMNSTSAGRWEDSLALLKYGME